MFNKLVILCVVSSVVLANPSPKLTPSSHNDLARSHGSYKTHDYSASYIDYEPQDELAEITKASTSIVELITALSGYKSVALSLAVHVISWAVANIHMIFLGSIVTFGFCKLTGKCSLNYEEYEPVAQLRSFMTPERLATAEKFFVRAVEKYSEENRARNSSK